DVARIASQYRDGRWNEVTALYCGMASATAARRLLELLIAQPTSAALSPVLAEAYLSAGPELARDRVLRKLVLERLARAPAVSSEFLDRFPSEEIAEIANDFVGTVSKETGLSGSYRWLFSHPKHINLERLVARYRMWKQLKPMPLSELVYLFHAHGSTQLGLLAEAACHGGVYKTKGPTFQDGTTYMHQAEIALMALEERFFSRLSRNKKVSYGGVAAVALPIWRVLATHGWTRFGAGEGLLSAIESEVRGQPAIRREFASLSRKIVTRAASMPKRESGRSLETRLSSWATLLEMDKSGATDSP
ncbi:MAG TPA: hypothetical protein VMW75_14280, partial [Thermoanaerobaculia bacterium]|nr:hypothetical protein [Thermoanaerobaculia bacterium]